MEEYSQTITTKFCQWLRDRYIDRLSNKYSRPAFEDESLVKKIEDFDDKLVLFGYGFKNLLCARLLQKGEVVYSNTSFVSDFDSVFCDETEYLAQQHFGSGVIDLLDNGVKFVLAVKPTKAKMTQEFYRGGEKHKVDVFEIMPSKESQLVL